MATGSLARIKRSGLPDQHLGKLGVSAPIAILVCIRKVVPRYGTVNAHVIKLGLHGSQASLDVAQAFAIG